jgi:hypothetical protein
MSWDTLKPAIYEKWKIHWFSIHPPDVAEYSWNYLFTGGKEIRSKLFCELWKYLSPDSEIFAELAFAIECIHVSSIVLDDTPWMDNANERRGRKTLHNVFSPKKAVLIAYELIDIVRHIWLNNKPSHISDQVWQNLLKTKLQRLAIGQWYDIEKKGDLIELASLKTGVLFELVTETVAICIGLDTEFWKIWGNNLGILFQWNDDYLDREQDIIQCNRNAFNEAYDITLKNYSYLWNKLESGIGIQWFHNPFGIYMKKYFTENINISKSNIVLSLTEAIMIPYPTNIVIPEVMNYKFEGKGIPVEFTGKDIIKRLFKVSEELFTIEELFTMSSIKINLWYIDETQWEHVPEIKELFLRIQTSI